MTIFEWNDSYSVGISCVDYQHRHLVERINELEAAVSFSSDEASLRRVVHGLLDYTEYHFSTEEALMRAAGPRLSAHYLRHRAEHEQFTAKIQQLSGTPSLNAVLDESLFDFLVRWLLDHILGSDKEMALLLAEQGKWSEAAVIAGHNAPFEVEAVLEDEHRNAVERSLLGALKESEIRFRSLSDSVPVLIWVCDADGKMILFNKQWSELTGYSEQQLRDGSWRDAVHVEDLDTHQQTIATGLEERQPVTHELRLRRHDGRQRWFWESTVPRFSRHGEFLGLIGTALDITERKHAERVLVHAREKLQREVTRQTAELRAANERLKQEKDEQRSLIQQLREAQEQLLQSEKMASIGQLAAGVAHEINNPVGYIASNLYTLENYIGDLLRLIGFYAESETALSDEQRQILERLKREIDLDYLRDDLGQLLEESKEGTERVKQIVQDLKDFSHVDEAEWQWTDLHKGINSTLNVVHNEIKYKASVVKDYGDLPQVRCRASQLNQVFMNLLVNAAQAIEGSGTITIRTGRNDSWVWVEIADNGIGIRPENLNRLFEPFFTTKPIGKGTGLGLSLSYGIVAKHGGRFEVASEPGCGATFRIWLPIGGPPEAAASDQIPEDDSQTSAA